MHQKVIRQAIRVEAKSASLHPMHMCANPDACAFFNLFQDDYVTQTQLFSSKASSPVTGGGGKNGAQSIPFKAFPPLNPSQSHPKSPTPLA
jgi:hypothetical protein